MGKVFGATSPVSSTASNPPSDVATTSASTLTSTDPSSDFIILSMPNNDNNSTSPTCLLPLTNGQTSSMSTAAAAAAAASVTHHFTHLPDLTMCIESASLDLSPEEIQLRLRDLLKENISLKETLNNNNVIMSEQFDRLTTWQDEVRKVHLNQRKKFEETKIIVEKLHEENMMLNEKINEFEEKEKSNFDKIELERLKDVETKLKVTEKENENLTVLNLQLKDELETQKEMVERIKFSRNQLVVEKQELLSVKSELESKLKIYTAQSVTTEKTQKTDTQSFVKEDLSSSGFRELLMQLNVEQEKSEALMIELMEVRKVKNTVVAELNSLKQSMSLENKSNVSSPPIAQMDRPKLATSVAQFEIQGNQMLHEMRESEKTLTESNKSARAYQERCNGLEARIVDYHERLESMQSKDDALIEQLRREIAELKAILATEQETNKKTTWNLQMAHTQFENLLRDYQQLLHSWESYEQEQADKGSQSVAYYEIQVKGLKEHIDNLTAQLVANEESCSSKDEELSRLRAQLKASVNELEKMSLMEAQMELYQTDFRIEREAREKLVQEKESLLSKIRELQARKMSDQGTISSVKRRSSPSFGSASTSYVRRTFKSPSPEDPPWGGEQYIRMGHIRPTVEERHQTHSAHSAEDERISELIRRKYLCPKCNLEFSELRALENHVNYCLDNEPIFQN